ncbi:VAN3-binding protein-like [Andrographis paniculata]|uniref:VAN3-binding protein-like n=1 Tax=Andrographis paniculata TaxID=175694 RepID=UPI0021E92632|nr:VAN3-binding protein-like [Andrographis paniculata]
MESGQIEFLSRTWTISSLGVSKPAFPHNVAATRASNDDFPATLPISGNPFSFASSETSKLVLDRIMSQSREVSPRTSGRQSLSDSPPVSPSADILEDHKNCLLSNSTGNNQSKSCTAATVSSGKTVGRWLKERREKKKEEVRMQNAQLHAAISVAGVAAAVAAIVAATAASSSRTGKGEQITKTDMAVASAATLVAAQCVEAAEGLGAERDHLTSVVTSAVNVRSPNDIMTLTAAAATALRGVATLKARALKEASNVASTILEDKMTSNNGCSNDNLNEKFASGEKFLGICSRELLAGGGELLKRTRKGDLHWKIVSVYINKLGQVMLKMKSRHVAGTVTKKKKNIVVEVLKDIPAWPGREVVEDGEQRRYFALKTVARGVVEFECMNLREYDIWTQGVSRLLAITTTYKNNNNNII